MGIGIIFIVTGIIFFIIGFFGLLIKSFSESVWWGLGCLFVPFVWIIYLIQFKEGRTSFVKVLISIPFLIIGIALMEGAF
jgi:hypothetical protein|tara:strand:+ start:390 stop:629 length:240 start_codon:yes stop_codon:yes gene_type:complete